MAKEEAKIDKLEREYIINLRRKVNGVPIYKRTPKAIRTVKEFLVRHMKIRDRDLNKVRLDRYLNEFLWARGIKNPMTRIKVKAIKEGDIVRVELAELPVGLKFKKLREEKREEKGAEVAKKKKKKRKQQQLKPEWKWKNLLGKWQSMKQREQRTSQRDNKEWLCKSKVFTNV